MAMNRHYIDAVKLQIAPIGIAFEFYRSGGGPRSTYRVRRWFIMFQRVKMRIAKK